MEPAVCDPSDPSALTEADLPILKEQHEISNEMIKRDREGRGFTFTTTTIDSDWGPCIYKRISGCGPAPSTWRLPLGATCTPACSWATPQYLAISEGRYQHRVCG